MAIEYISKIYSQPKNPTIYTGLFEKKWLDREWSDKPNKCLHGVSYTKYEDAMNISVGTLKLFDLFHGYCDVYACIFANENPEWKIQKLFRGLSKEFKYDKLIHSFCTKRQGQKTLFADARGITDDPVEFFSDFILGKTLRLQKNPYTNIVIGNVTSDCESAYHIIYDDIERKYNYVHSKRT